VIRGPSKKRDASEKTEVKESDFYVSIGTKGRATGLEDRAPGSDEDQTDRLENQKVREVSKKNQMFDLLDLEVERKVRDEILQARFSTQKSLEEEATEVFFEQKVRDEELADLL
jgi:hypothetical protein